MHLPQTMYFLCLALFISACAAPTEKTLSYAEELEKAHKKDAFQAKEAVQFDFILNFGGSERLNGKITLTTDSSNGLIESKKGNKIYFLEDKVYHNPEMENAGAVRFSAYTWSYFFLFPYKLNDPGTQWQDFPETTLNGKEYLTGKLSFDAGTGDAPDDWYISYANAESKLIEVAAYIVTAGASQEEAEKDPHAIAYENYQVVEGIPISTDWTFWEWRKEQGLTKELGNATLRNVKFVDLPEDFWMIPDDFLEK